MDWFRSKRRGRSRPVDSEDETSDTATSARQKPHRHHHRGRRGNSGKKNRSRSSTRAASSDLEDADLSGDQPISDEKAPVDIKSPAHESNLLISDMPRHHSVLDAIEITVDEGELISVRPATQITDEYAWIINDSQADYQEKYQKLCESTLNDPDAALRDQRHQPPKLGKRGKAFWKQILRKLKDAMTIMKVSGDLSMPKSLGTVPSVPEHPPESAFHRGQLKQYIVQLHSFGGKETKISVIVSTSPLALLIFTKRNNRAFMGLDTETAPPAAASSASGHLPHETHRKNDGEAIADEILKVPSMSVRSPDLLQIAGQKEILLFQITQACSESGAVLVTKCLNALFKDTKRFYSGVSIESDRRYLTQLPGLHFLASTIDIARAAKLLFQHIVEDTSIKTKRFLGLAHLDYDRLLDFWTHDGLWELTYLLCDAKLPKTRKRRPTELSRINTHNTGRMSRSSTGLSGSLWNVTEIRRIVEEEDTTEAESESANNNLPPSKLNIVITSEQNKDTDTQSICSRASNRSISVSTLAKRRTDWATPVLDEFQVGYAALDAWASLKCWDVLCDIYELWRKMRKGNHAQTVDKLELFEEWLSGTRAVSQIKQN